MAHFLALRMALLLSLLCSAIVVAKEDDADNDAEDAGDEVDQAPASPDDEASTAAESAKQAAKVANRVAVHSVKITEHAQTALKKARSALHDARVDTSELDDAQRQSLKEAENHLREATQRAEYGKLQAARDGVGETDGQLQEKLDKLQNKLESSGQSTSSVEAMREELGRMRDELEARKMSEEKSRLDGELHDIEEDMRHLEAGTGKSSRTHDEMKAEIGRIHEEIRRLEAQEAAQEAEMRRRERESQEEAAAYRGGRGGQSATGWSTGGTVYRRQKTTSYGYEPEPGEQRVLPYDDADTPVQEKGIDVDTEMPYGELEPFGREDTAQELTEASIRESDEMVDQLERAEVAEEKRAVFRALTRLRGAAITSYDGVARAQTGNIDEYNKTHKWRKTHPLHHLADEESDISKWAFPDNADF